MRSYGQIGPVSRRQRASQRARTPYSRAMGTAQKKRGVVLALFYNTAAERSKDEPWCNKSFREIWEGNIEYSDHSSESEIMNTICVAYNSSLPTNKPNLTHLETRRGTICSQKKMVKSQQDNLLCTMAREFQL